MAIEVPVWSRESPIRLFVGITVGRRSGRLKTVAVRCRGAGWNLRTLAVDAVTLPSPASDCKAIVGSMVSSIGTLVGEIGAALDEVDCLGLGVLPATIPSSLAAAQVAEQTGITVVSGFADADAACGGLGEPLSLVPDWFLHRSTRVGRLLVHLGRTLRLTMLAAGASPENVLCFDSGPCCGFLDGLVDDLSQGRYPFDPNGHFAVQGRTCEELVSKWSSHPYLLQIPPKFLDDSEFGADFRQTSLSFARDHKLSAHDVLCSANHFVVRNLADSIDRLQKLHLATNEILVSGGGVRNRMLWKLVSEQRARVPVRLTDDVGVPSEARRAIHCAILACCAMDNLPGNVTAATGARRAALLGHVTPGSAQNWDRWVCNLADRFDVVAGRAA